MGDLVQLPKRCAWQGCGRPIRNGELAIRSGRDENLVFHAQPCYVLHCAVLNGQQGKPA